MVKKPFSWDPAGPHTHEEPPTLTKKEKRQIKRITNWSKQDQKTSDFRQNNKGYHLLDKRFTIGRN